LHYCRRSGCIIAGVLVALLQAFSLHYCMRSGCMFAGVLIASLQAFWLLHYRRFRCIIAGVLVALLQALWLHYCMRSGCMFAGVLVAPSGRMSDLDRRRPSSPYQWQHLHYTTSLTSNSKKHCCTFGSASTAACRVDVFSLSSTHMKLGCGIV
jgi:hypothetical protein